MIEPRIASSLMGATPILALAALALGCATVAPAPPPAPAEVTAGATPEATPAGPAATKDVIRRVVRSHAAETRFCYERRLALSEGLAGKVTLSWIIQADGTVRDATIVADSTTLLDEEVHRCLRDAVGRWSFPAHDGKATKVSYPFLFRE